MPRKIIDLSKDVRDVTYFTTRNLTMTVDVPQEFQLDGDEFGEAAQVHLTLDIAALTVNAFEGTISKVAVIAVFMPIIAGHGGNTGTQAATLVVRGLALLFELIVGAVAEGTPRRRPAAAGPSV